MLSTTPNLNKRHTQSNLSDPLQKISLMHYVGFFAIGYVLASVIFIMIQTQVMLNPQVVTTLSVLVGAYIAVYKFIKHQRRALNSSEINRLTIGSISIVWLLTAVYFLGLWVFLFDRISREVLIDMVTIQPVPLLGATVMMVIITLVSARIGFWIFNRLLAPK